VTLRDLALLAQEKREAQAVLLCATVARDAIAAWLAVQQQAAAAESDLVQLSAGGDMVQLTGSEPFPWAISAQAVDPLWSHTLRNPGHRTHTLGWQLKQYNNPVPAAKAVEAVTDAAENTRAGRRTPAVPPGSTRRRRLSRLR
jgi:hypothetical protein